MLLLATAVFISSPALAVTSPPALDLSENEEPSTAATPEEINRSHQVELTQPPPVRISTQESDDYYYHYRQALSLHGGLSANISDFQNPQSIIGFQYRFAYPENGRSEVGADLLTSGSGLLHASRFFFSEDGRFRFFYKYGVELRVIPSEELVTFLKLVNWRARIAGGLEWNAWNSVGLRLDLEAHIGTSERFLTLLTGFAYSY